MEYPNKIYICRNMMNENVDILVNGNKRLLNNKECDCCDIDNGKCLHDDARCAIVEYQKVKK